MHTSLILAILFAGFLNCAHSAPQSNTDTVLQELQSILAQNSPSEEPSKEPAEGIDLLCRIVGEETIDVNSSNNGPARVQESWWRRLISCKSNKPRVVPQEQEKAEVIGLACTPVQDQPNGELTFLKLK